MPNEWTPFDDFLRTHCSFCGAPYHTTARRHVGYGERELAACDRVGCLDRLQHWQRYNCLSMEHCTVPHAAVLKGA